MTQVVVPVRYPLSKRSKATLRRGIEEAEARDAELTVLHVNLYQQNPRVSRSALKAAVERAFGELPDVRFTVRSGLLVEETILEEVADQRADVVVIGRDQESKWRKMIRRLSADPDIERFLREELDAELVTVSP
jgi:nucleotide-binding universal stress UspA family protein